jgi:hypothetical protein
MLQPEMILETVNIMSYALKQGMPVNVIINNQGQLSFWETCVSTPFQI